MGHEVDEHVGKPPRVKIGITDEIIADAEQRSSSHCMIADAIRKQLPDANAISVDLQTIRWSDKKTGRRYIYLTPRRAQVAIVKFDQGHHTEPFEFQLRSGQSMPSKRNASKGGRIRTSHKGRMENPTIIDGHAPPLAALGHGPKVRGQRRTFGLKLLEQ